METMAARRKEPRPRRSFSDEFKAEVVELVHQPGNTAASVARQLDLTETAVRQWVKQAEIDWGGRHDGLTSLERSEMARLRKELREVREERDILKRAVVFFARETR
jgi:transposase